MATLINNYPSKLFLGINGDKRIYLSAPSWDCGWYWGFGYLGNRDCHYHVNNLKRVDNRDLNLYDGFKEHFGESFIVKEDKDIWTLAELFQTFYILKETAECLNRGGAHYTTNPCMEIIKNGNETERINTVVLPAVFDEIYKILLKYK